jgi:hypothetical protein
MAAMGGERTLPPNEIHSLTVDFQTTKARVVNMSDKPNSNRRVNIIEAVFGERLTGDDLLRHKAARPSKKIYYALQIVRLILITVLGAWVFNLEGRLPLIGTWLAQSRLAVFPVWAGCLSILAFSEWFYERRERTLQR